MPKRCVVGKCGALNKDGLSLHKFPKDEKVRKVWVEFVQSTRQDSFYATQYSHVCSLHFQPNCYRTNKLAVSLGFGPRNPGLTEGAVPTIRAGLGEVKVASSEPSSVDVVMIDKGIQCSVNSDSDDEYEKLDKDISYYPGESIHFEKIL